MLHAFALGAFGQLAAPDEAYPVLIRNLIPTGLRGFMLAAIAGAVISSLASMMNSAATVFTMDIYRRWIDRGAPQRRLILAGRAATLLLPFYGAGFITEAVADPGARGWTTAGAFATALAFASVIAWVRRAA